jgi:hypothetical protein
MIPCPICSGPTQVRETRGNERRRMCKRFECGGKVTTREVAVEALKEVARLVGQR